MPTTELWICGLSDAFDESWDIVGIFETKDEALGCCRKNLHFVAPVPLGVDLGDSREDEWPGLYYPALENPDGSRKSDPV